MIEARKTISMCDLVSQVMSQIESVCMNKIPDSNLKTGFSDLDQLIGGLYPGQLLIFGGLPGMGKTAFALTIADHLAIEQGQGVAIFSLEMMPHELVTRMIAARAKLRLLSLRTGFFDHERGDFQKLASAATELSNSPVLIENTPGLKITELMTRARRLKEENNIKLLIVDCLQLLKSNTESLSVADFDQAAEIGFHLKTLARELDISVLALCQLDHKVEKNHQIDPRIRDLRKFISIEPYADVIMFLLRREYFAEHEEDRQDWKGHAHIRVAKNRNGNTGWTKLFFHAETTRFENYKRKIILDEDFDP